MAAVEAVSEPAGMKRCECAPPSFGLSDRGLVACKLCGGWLCLIIHSRADLEHAHKLFQQEVAFAAK